MNHKKLMFVFFITLFTKVMPSQPSGDQYPYGHGPINTQAREKQMCMLSCLIEQANTNGEPIPLRPRAVYKRAACFTVDHIRQFHALGLLQEAIKRSGASWSDVELYAKKELDDFVDRHLALPTVGLGADVQEHFVPSANIIEAGAAAIVDVMLAKKAATEI